MHTTKKMVAAYTEAGFVSIVLYNAHFYEEGS